MKLTKAPDTKYLKNRYIDEESKIEVGIYPVLFGWRVQAGKLKDDAYYLDYCCGSTANMVQVVQSLVIAILEKNDANWLIFPHQKVKPVFNDMDCFMKLFRLAGEHDKVEIPDLIDLRKEIMSSICKDSEIG